MFQIIHHISISKIIRVNIKCTFQRMITFINGKKAKQTNLTLCGKSKNPLAGCANPGSNNCCLNVLKTGNESFTSLWKNFGPLFFGREHELSFRVNNTAFQFNLSPEFD
ncbi:hypothetical protein ATANTOWER_002020 [Ataeniobius toweri]|uniref:Uncharacterized protein n=1 Tax=Ataeniobius toweri TaxID=208326 RepID=A0ABU7ANX0_9TELE|nr:hypothetical protein [Ataeniobius toweri]